MPWIKKQGKFKIHRCQPPEISWGDEETGDIWECDRCRKWWVLIVTKSDMGTLFQYDEYEEE